MKVMYQDEMYTVASPKVKSKRWLYNNCILCFSFCWLYYFSSQWWFTKKGKTVPWWRKGNLKRDLTILWLGIGCSSTAWVLAQKTWGFSRHKKCCRNERATWIRYSGQINNKDQTWLYNSYIYIYIYIHSSGSHCLHIFTYVFTCQCIYIYHIIFCIFCYMSFCIALLVVCFGRGSLCRVSTLGTK